MALAIDAPSRELEMSSTMEGLIIEEEEEDELFEIDLASVDNIPPPYYWEGYFTATNNTLLANCLLPIDYISRAVPSPTKVGDASLSSSLSYMAYETDDSEEFVLLAI
ncbi:hypothetical protein Leryth_000957 [Lithospermum erythrorhizon]|uniref:Uncharacterized protein n=1 Tax=Lithospermum erythrorhizon TaxID=34254 RepID=A0AAV3P1T6_LITER|nr:hypothetical protein Leryth_000957 [Lithospermum erythrorhizon]